jgi:ribosomal protein L37E
MTARYTYTLGKDVLSGDKTITCLRCGKISFNPNDVSNLYCGFCHAFHDPQPAKTQTSQVPPKKPNTMRQRHTSKTPYASAASGNARDEIMKILRRFGCESVGFMDSFETHEVILAFTHRGRPVQLKASAQGWANLYMQENPYNTRRRASKTDYEQEVLQQGFRAVNSILRDWIKGQVTAVETGVLQFDAVFMPYMLTADGRPLLDRLREQSLLPAPKEPKEVKGKVR